MQASLPNPSRSRVNKDLWSLGVLPITVFGSLSGLLGVNWDIAWHIDKGRDTFFTPPHNFIYSCLLIVLVTSLWALLVDRRATSFHLQIAGFRLHAGVLIGTVSATLGLVFAPADELWHQFFGVDATLWGPMHLIGLTSFALSNLGGIVTCWLEREVAQTPARARLFERLTVFFAGMLLGYVVLFLAEYEFNVTQFAVDFHPLILAGATLLPLYLIARLKPWGATLAALVFTGFRLLIGGWLIVSERLDLAGSSRPVIPVLILSAVAVDLLVRRLPAWAVGLVAGAVTLAVNAVLVANTNMMSWTPPVLLRGGLAGLILAAITATLAAGIARALQPIASPPSPTSAQSLEGRA